MTVDSSLKPEIISKISYKGTNVVVFEDVYEPAEDSFLLADCAVSFLLEKFQDEPFSTLEVGCGSGFVSAFVQSRFPCVSLIAVDINPNAVACACENGVHAVLSNMFDQLKNFGLPQRGYDVILFNPPYLPTSEDEKVTGWLNYAFDGGVSGRELIDKFLESVSDYLSEDGIFLILISSLTGLEEVLFKMKTCGFEGNVIGWTKCSFEDLMVLKGSRQ
ncbi:MAG: class I SAM-dependent methyltransferase [Methanimicrococcus sp.]|nr:class I SAM-dependent methyltransferase [Methanimicrococcus sp.]